MLRTAIAPADLAGECCAAQAHWLSVELVEG